MMTENHDNTSYRGRLYIVSAPSGAGKTTLLQQVLERIPDLAYSISYTSRRPRRGEQNGVDYHFVSEEEFAEGIEQQRWAEWAIVHGNYYGTSSEDLENNLVEGKDILLDLDVQGTFQILHTYPQSITIFIQPPSFDTLKERLEKRGTDSKESILERLKNAEKELKHKNRYQHIITNDRISSAVDELVRLIEKFRLLPQSD